MTAFTLAALVAAAGLGAAAATWPDAAQPQQRKTVATLIVIEVPAHPRTALNTQSNGPRANCPWRGDASAGRDAARVAPDSARKPTATLPDGDFLSLPAEHQRPTYRM